MAKGELGLKKKAINLIVFVTGGCVLVVEVAATRILAPYFGNTIFTVSSVLGVVLAALSLGYYWGGKLADKNPSQEVFFKLIAGSGVGVLGLLMLSQWLLPILGLKLSLTWGPLLAAGALFFLPALFLGTLSPFAIKLQTLLKTEKEGVGSVAGEVFFWSTLGSIAGSLLTGFVFIPRFGVSQIILATGGVLVVMGLVALKWPRWLMLLVAVVGLGNWAVWPESGQAVYVDDGVYEKITIYDGVYDGRPTRYFMQDRSASGAMFLDGEELVFEYTKYYDLYRYFVPELRRALFIGGGAYSMPKAMLKEAPEAEIEVAEIEPELFELSQKYFRVPDDPRLKNVVEDGRRYLSKSDKKYDMIFSDVYYSLYSVPAHFTTREFFELAKSRLSNGGIFVANLIGTLSRQKPSLILSEMRTLQAVFPQSYFFAVGSKSSLMRQNIILVGVNGEGKVALSGELLDKQIDPGRFNLVAYAELTDNYAPVEYLTAKVLERSERGGFGLSGEEVLAGVEQQLSYGPRYLSAPGHRQIQEFLEAELAAVADEVAVQEWTVPDGRGGDYGLKNIVGRFSPKTDERVILATHYDSKRFADRDATDPDAPVPGANDAASGTAVLLEVAHHLAQASRPRVGVDLVFFDGEEGVEDVRGDYTRWTPLGSNYLANNLPQLYPGRKPVAGVVIDMVCDKQLNIYQELSSARDAGAVVRDFWQTAREVNPGVFKSTAGREILDDHTPLNAVGIPSILVIDFDYGPFHTRADTLDKCSFQSLETVGEALLKYVYSL